MSIYGLIGLLGLVTGSYLGTTKSTRAGRDFKRNPGKTVREDLDKQTASWYGTAGLAILGILTGLGGAYIMGSDAMAYYI